MKLNPLTLKDFYKTGHIFQYPKGTQEVYSNFTARKLRFGEGVVAFGIQYFVMEYLMNQFNENFFQQPIEKVLAQYKRRMDTSLGPDAVSLDHIRALHQLGYLPIELKSLPEGTVVPEKVPVLTIRNTLPEFFWVTNFLETLISAVVWHPMTTATIAHEYKKIFDSYAAKTSDIPEFVQWQGHDFSMRGQTSIESACVGGSGHLLSFTGTDTIPAIDFLEQYYGADATKELIGGSVPATEHSVMCLGGNETELETFKRLITEVYPAGIISIVSDTWDYWKVLGDIVPTLKSEILARNGKVVIRPDSGDPVKIICGDTEATGLAYIGTVQALWDTFGGTVNSKGYKQLDPHIGVIYGDSITLERAQQILSGLEAKGFASTNVVFGIGSYTYQYVTRDTFGFAMKATHGVINGAPVDIYKNPKTDDGVKKSAKGLLKVNFDLTLQEQATPQEEKEGMLETIFLNGKLVKKTTLNEIRNRLNNRK